MPVSDFLQIVIPKFSQDDASTLANHLEALGHIPIIISKNQSYQFERRCKKNNQRLYPIFTCRSEN